MGGVPKKKCICYCLFIGESGLGLLTLFFTNSLLGSFFIFYFFNCSRNISHPLKCIGRYHPSYFDVISGPRTFLNIIFGNQCFVLLELELFFQ